MEVASKAYFGAWCLGAISLKESRVFKRLDPTRARCIFEKTASIQDDWPKNWLKFLKGNRNSKLSAVSNTLIKHQLMERDVCKYLKCFLDGFPEIMNDNIHEKSAVAGVYEVADFDDYLSVADLMTILSCSRLWVDWLIQDLSLTMKIVSKRGKLKQGIHRTKIPNMIEHKRNLKSLNQTAKAIVISKDDLIAKIQDFGIKPTRGPNVDGFRFNIYDIKNIQRKLTLKASA